MLIKLILSLIIIVGVGAAAFSATSALLSDTAILAANTFSTGTFDLQISKSTSSNPTTFASDSITGFTDTFLPGQSKSKTFWLKNNSTDIDFATAAQSSSISGEISPGSVTVAFTPVSNDDTSVVGTATSHTLTEWGSVSALDSNIGHGGKQRYRMEVTLDPSVTTTGSINFDFVFTGTEVVPAPTVTPTVTPTP